MRIILPVSEREILLLQYLHAQYTSSRLSVWNLERLFSKSHSFTPVYEDEHARYCRLNGVFGKMGPASTEIGAANQYGAALICDLLAIQPKTSRVKIESVDSPLQGSALN